MRHGVTRTSRQERRDSDLMRKITPPPLANATAVASLLQASSESLCHVRARVRGHSFTASVSQWAGIACVCVGVCVRLRCVCARVCGRTCVCVGERVSELETMCV
jgi:hypothetical protein